MNDKKFSSQKYVAIVASRFNPSITKQLVASCVTTLTKGGVARKNIKTVWVPGAYELPFAAQKLAVTHDYDAVLCLGCIIKGETSHDVHIANWAAAGIGQVGLTTGIPTLFGVLTPNDEAQAKERSRLGSKLNRGYEVAKAALEMISLNRKGF